MTHTRAGQEFFNDTDRSVEDKDDFIAVDVAPVADDGL
jgi:hypothetical protein